MKNLYLMICATLIGLICACSQEKGGQSAVPAAQQEAPAPVAIKGRYPLPAAVEQLKDGPGRCAIDSLNGGVKTAVQKVGVPFMIGGWIAGADATIAPSFSVILAGEKQYTFDGMVTTVSRPDVASVIKSAGPADNFGFNLRVPSQDVVAGYYDIVLTTGEGESGIRCSTLVRVLIK